ERRTSVALRVAALTIRCSMARGVGIARCAAQLLLDLVPVDVIAGWRPGVVHGRMRRARNTWELNDAAYDVGGMVDLPVVQKLGIPVCRVKHPARECVRDDP